MTTKQNKIIFSKTETITVGFEVNFEDKNYIFDCNREVKRLEGKV